MADKRSKIVLVLFFISAVVVLALSLYTGFALNAFVDSLEESRNQRLLAEAQATSLIVSADELEALQDESDLSSDTAAALERRLSAFADLHDLTAITFIRELPSGELQYIISSSTGKGTYDLSAGVLESNTAIAQSFAGTVVVTDMRDTQASINGLMAYSPVYDASGSVVAVAAVGIDDAGVIKSDTMIRDLTIILLICIAIVILAACANVLLQVRKEHELQESVRVQKLMIEISQQLASEQPFNERLYTTLESLGMYLDASRVYIVNLSDGEIEESLRQHWSFENANPHNELDTGRALRKAMRNTFDADDETKRSSMYVSNIKTADTEQQLLMKESGAEALIWSPLIVQNEIWGVLALNFSQAQGQFHDRDIQLVESTVSDLVGAITRELYSEQRELALDHAVLASEAKSEFLSNMSHEMRTPMNAIIGMTSIALDSDDSARKDYCLNHVKDASAHLLTIINDVLDMSSLQSNELSLNNKPFDLRKTLNDVVRDYIYKIQEHNQVFKLEIDEQIPSMLIGDKQRLSKVVGNLLSNATKFTPDGGSITLRVQHKGINEDGHNLYFEVEDSGIGLNQAMRDNLFGSFEQADSGTNRKYGGTGLGLAITRRLVDLMGGQIGVDSAIDEGSTFFFTIVLVEHCANDTELSELEKGLNGLSSTGLYHFDEGASVPSVNTNDSVSTTTSSSPDTAPNNDTVCLEEEVSPPKRSTPNLSAYRILLAEDIEINREVVLALLDDSGIVIDIATNGIEVFEAVKSNPGGYDLIFMDLQMPEMDGLDATRRIRALEHPELVNLPIIAMTANVHEDDINACLDAGMNGHIGKPVDLEEIYRILEAHLPKR